MEGSSRLRTFHGREQSVTHVSWKGAVGYARFMEGSSRLRTFHGREQSVTHVSWKGAVGDACFMEGSSRLRMFHGREQSVTQVSLCSVETAVLDETDSGAATTRPAEASSTVTIR